MEEKICGTSLEKIRKMYFTGKIDKLLVSIQANGNYDLDEYNKLADYLETLKVQDDKLSVDFSRFLPKLENDSYSVLDELNQDSLSDAEIAELEREKVNRANAVQMANKMLKGLFMKFYDPNQESPNEESLMDMAFEMLSLQYYLKRDSLYKERLFRKKIVEYERAGCQRKLAEEKAKTTVEFRDYALAEHLLESCKELILLAKKRYKDNF